MIIDFTVENFRSIKDAVTLSAVAVNRKTRPASDGSRRPYVVPDSEIAVPHPVDERGFGILPVLAIFGPNASGKSNLLMALDWLLQMLAHRSHESEADVRRPAPFALDPATRFSLRAALDGVIYSYSLSLKLKGQGHQPHILQERLEYLPPRPMRTRLLFERHWKKSQGKYEFRRGDDFSGGERLKRYAQLRDRPFLGQIVGYLKDQDKAAEEKSLAPLTRWLWRRWPGVGLGYEALDRELGYSLGAGKPEIQRRVADLVRRFDTGVIDLDIEPYTVGAGERTTIQHRVFLRYASGARELPLPLEEVSTGTRELIGLAYRMFYSFEEGTLLLVDDLGAHFHPYILHAIVRLFQDARTNPRRAQLVFASHDATLLSDRRLRRDQVWFTQLRADGSSALYPLSSFKVRNDLAIDRAYLDGRFDAVPILPAEWDLLPVEETSPA